MKRILYILALMAAASSLSCKKAAIQPDQGSNDQDAKTPIELGVRGINVSAIQNAATSSRTIGSAMDDLSDFAGEKLAVFGVTELFADQSQLWKPSERLFSTEAATIEINATTSIGSINYYGDPANKVYYPAGGSLNVYALYPAATEYLKIVEPTLEGTPPSADVVLATKFAEQYDILHGATESLTVAQAQRAEVVFNHALAQLKFKIYKENSAISARVSSITISGVSKAAITDIRKANFTLSTKAEDSLDFEVYKDVATEITATTKESAVSIGSPLMLFPGTESVRWIIVTIDGQTYTTPVPKDWSLNQGKINTITIRINQFGVRLEEQWAVSPWGKGQGVDQGLENNGKYIRVSAPLVNANKTTYSGTAEPAWADITIADYTHKNIVVTYDNATKKFTTDWFNSGSLNNEPIYLDAITLYDLNATAIFQGVLKNGRLSSGLKIEIDTVNNGALKINNAALALDMDFGGLGDGSINAPYQVSTPTHLDNVRKYLGALTGNLSGTPAAGAYFAQVNDIDLSSHLALTHNGTTFEINNARKEPFIGSTTGWNPIGENSKQFYGSYDGQTYKISGLYINQPSKTYVGMFGSVGVVSQSSSKNSIKNITIASGYISGEAFIGSIAGAAAVNITACHNYADLKAFKTTGATNIGGLIGSLSSATGIVSQSSNYGNVSSVWTDIGGLVGTMSSATRIEKSFNAGNVSGNNYVGGLAGRSSGGTVINCYNSGEISSTMTTDGLFIGGIAASITNSAAIKNSYNRTKVKQLFNKYTSSGAMVGFAGALSGALSAAHTNNYFLVQPPLRGVGAVGSTSNMDYAAFASKTEAELKTLAPTLGAAWAEDTENINDGYPVLTWQK